MSKIETLEQVAEKLGDGGPHNPDTVFTTVEEVVDALVDTGNIPKVFAFHDEHLGLKSSLPEELLKTPIDEVDEDKFEEEIKNILDNANRIIPLSERELSEEDEEDIREDMQSRGEDTND